MADAIFTNGIVRIEVGNSGTQGPAGADGTDGTDGAQGPVGPQGPPGPAGADGADGADGAQGPAGMDGAAGIDGEPGATGPQGPAGQDGQALLTSSLTEHLIDVGVTGVVVPVEGLTVNLPSGRTNEDYDFITGRVWVGSDIANANLFVFPVNTGLENAASFEIGEFKTGSISYAGEILGEPTGTNFRVVVRRSDTDAPVAARINHVRGLAARGEAGPEGDPGPAGTDGATGPRGPDGLQGIQGQQGLQGPAGEQGLTGPPGADGADGATGGQGIQGPQGDPGPAGTTQWSGLTGRPAIYSYFAIWAEETTNLITNNFQFSFGNGNPTTDGSGIVLPFNCDLIAMSASFEVAGTATIVVRRNSSSPQNIILQNSRHGYNDFEANPVACTAGDIINFQTTFVTGQVHGVVVTAWFRRLVA